MTESDEAAFLTSMKLAKEENGIYEEANGVGAATESNNTSDEYDPAQAVPTVHSFPPLAQESFIHQTPSSALLNETMSTSTVPDVSSTVVPTTQDPSVANGPDHQSESRSMSRTTSSDTSQTLITDQPPSGLSLIQKKATIDSATNGDKTVPIVGEPTSAVPATSLNDIAATPTPGAEDISTPLMQNGDSLSAANSVLPTSNGVASIEGGPANSAETLRNASNTTAGFASIKEPVATAPSLPKARLPHDTIGVLEDRIKEDPRGDMDAWLSLIREYRKRGKLDEARSVYERFFVVFPAAVGLYSGPPKREVQH